MRYKKIIKIMLGMLAFILIMYTNSAELTGKNVFSELKSFIIDTHPPYFVEGANITSAVVYITTNLTCTVKANDSINMFANMSWYVNGKAVLNDTGNNLTNNILFVFENLTYTNLSKGARVSCNITVYDAIMNTNTTSESITVQNTLPSNVTLYSPNSSSSDTNRNPFFNWSDSIDSDGDNLTYFLEIDNSSDFSSVNFNVTNITEPNYTLKSDLNVDEMYYWRVRVYDQYEFSGYSETWNYTVISYLSITVAGAIDFGSGYVYENNATAKLDSRTGTAVNGSWSFNSQNISLQNNGNVDSRIVASAPNATYWISPGATAEIIGVENSTNDGCSDTYSWLNLNETSSVICSNLNYTNYTDIVGSALRVTIPENATAGAKSMQITYTASIA